MKKSVSVILFAFAVLFSAQSAFAQEEIDKKVSFDFDGLARIRYEFLNNNSTLGLANDERDYFRFKFSAGAAADFFDVFSLYGKLTTESRSYIYNADANARYDISETVIDSLFITIPKLFGVLDIKAGRMDLSPAEYGEGFLLGDGTPLDGSRTYYFNAAKFKYNMPKGSVELLTVHNTEYDDLLVINDQSRRVNDSQESAIIIYGRTQTTEKLYIEPYYMRKTETAVRGAQLSGHYADLETSVNTFGSYFKYDLQKIVLRAQAALQLGDYGDKIGRAFGGYAYADVPVLNIFRPLSLGYIYLSGDNGSTSAVEGWNPLFSRYPWVSEILAVLYSGETGAGYWTNLRMARIEATFRPVSKMTVNASYDFVYANETARNAGTGIFGSGLNRGNLMRLKLAYSFSSRFGAYVLGEYFIPGDFYYKEAKDASFLRAEFSAKI